MEDSPTQAELLQAFLEEEGFAVEVAGDGAAGLQTFASSSFDLVISDIHMPGLSGYDLCRRIKTDFSHRNVPVMLLTSLSDPMDIIQGLECGGDNFFTKPFEPTQLLERVRAVLKNRTSAGSSRIKIGAEIEFLGKKLSIDSDKEQILGLLISTFEEIVRSNRNLRTREQELAQAKVQLDQYARRLEGQVRSSEDKYRTIMEQAQDAILLADAEGRVLEVNQKTAELFGRPEERIVNTPLDQWIPEATEELKSLTISHRSAKKFVRLGARLQRPDSGKVQVDCSVSRLNLDGESVLLAFLHDVTERNRLEQQLFQAQKMESIGRLAGGVAHDFNNLLTIINGYSEMLVNDELSKETWLSLVEEIQKAGDRAAGLTRQLLAFSRRQVLQPRVLDLNAAVTNTESLLRRLIGEDIELKTNLNPNLKLIKADPGQVEQVIMNLAVNARDAMPTGGKLTIETANVTLEAASIGASSDIKPGPFVALIVEDSGCGMDAVVLSQIFEPFFSTKGDKGTGLGLSTVFGIVKQSGGLIEVSSEVGKGTTFKILLPANVVESAPSRSNPGLEHSSPQGNETLLLVEDEEAVRKLMYLILQMKGYKLLEAQNGAEAIAICEEYRDNIDLIVTDVVMPNLSGRELAERLRALRPNLKVLFLSGYTDDAIVRHGIVESEMAFLQKPFSTDALAFKVREVLSK